MYEKYYEAVRYLETLIKLPQKYNYMEKRDKPEVYLKRTQSFLDLLGNPEKDFQYIHISGTSGKGTVSSMTAETLSKAGFKTGLVTSPFAVTTIEKLAVDGLYISPEDFADIVEEIKPKIDEVYISGKYGRPSYFEMLLAIALIYFKRQGCQWVVLEVGCGGRYDYTNIIPPKNKKVAGITNIDRDHLHIIGPTLKDVAYEKAGIIKKGCDFFTTEHRPELLKIFKEECAEVGADFHQVERGEVYQESNKRLVEAILPSIGVEEEVVEKINMPCRFEMIEKGIILDGAHNPAKIEGLVSRYMREYKEKCVVVFGAGENKDAKKMLDLLTPIAKEIVLTRTMSGPYTPFSPKILHRYLKKKGVRVSMYLDPYKALEVARGREDMVVATGSFFLTGDLRQVWYSEEDILKNRSSFD